MSRIAKADVHAALLRAANNLIAAGGHDKIISRSDVDVATKGMESKAEAALTKQLFKFVDARDHKDGARVTEKDVYKALGYAKKHVINNKDVNNNGLSRLEATHLSNLGQLAVTLAEELKGPKPGADPLAGDDYFTNLKHRVTVSARHDFRKASDVTDPAIAKMVIAAANAGGYDSTTLADVFDQDDDGDVIVCEMKEPRTGQKLISVDYGAGGNTCGAIFSERGKMLRSIQDGSLEKP